MAGLLFGWYFTFSCYKFSKDAAQDTMLGILLGTATLFFVIGIVHRAAKLEFDAAKTLWCGAGRAGGGARCGCGTGFEHSALGDSVCLNLQQGGRTQRRLGLPLPLHTHTPAATRPQGRHGGGRAVPLLHRAAVDDVQGAAPPGQLLAQRAAVVSPQLTTR
jgi:hypothetical protein